MRPVPELIDPLVLAVVRPVARLCAALLDLVVVVVVVVVARLLLARVRPVAHLLAALLGFCLHYGFLLFVGWLPVLVVLAVVWPFSVGVLGVCWLVAKPASALSAAGLVLRLLELVVRLVALTPRSLSCCAFAVAAACASACVRRWSSASVSFSSVSFAVEPPPQFGWGPPFGEWTTPSF